jgi:hypothetical protein
MIKFKFYKTFLMFMSLGILAFGFQNCAKNEYKFEDAMVQAKLDFFEYRYTKATPVYFDVHLTLDSEDSNNKLYKIFIFAAAADNAVTTINYDVKIYNEANVEVCPGGTGTILSTESSLEFTCITSKTAVISNVELKVKKSSDGEWNVYKKKYGN